MRYFTSERRVQASITLRLDRRSCLGWESISALGRDRSYCSSRVACPSGVSITCSIRCIHSIGSLGSFCSQISGCKEQWEDTRLKKRGDLGNSCESSLWFTLLKALIIIRSGGAALDILSDVTSSCARPALCSVGLLHDEVHVQDACPRPHVQN